jgi:short-subunit dehydrogenase
MLCSDAEMLAQMDTNFFGCLRTIKGAVPAFREAKNGTIVNISSGAGIVGRPSRGLYAGSKFALEGNPCLQLTFTYFC